MIHKSFKSYWLNCFLLTIPVLIWNIALAEKLPQSFQPEIFWHQIPALLTVGENVSRLLVFILAALMPISYSWKNQIKGWAIYWAGIVLYFSSWLMLILLPNSPWSQSSLGFMAPAYTPLLWLLGIAFIGDSYYFNLPFRKWFFVAVSIVFLAFHNGHTYLIFTRTH